MIQNLLLVLTCILGINIDENENTILNDPRMKTRVIINPKAGTESKKALEGQLKSLNPSKFDVEILYTTGPHHATLLSKEAADLNYDLVIAVGGDGTVNEVGKGLIGSSCTMGIIPIGSGNGLAKHLQIPTDLKKAIAMINDYHCKSIDTIEINEDHFIGIAGIGFDAQVAWEFSLADKRGFWTYATLVLDGYSHYKSRSYDIEVDQKLFRKEGWIVSFANSTQYGNNIKIAPDAKIDDGYLNMVILKKPPFYSVLDIFLKLKKGTITQSKYYESICCKELFIRDHKIYAHIDGEPLFFENGIYMKVNPKSLRVVVP